MSYSPASPTFAKPSMTVAQFTAVLSAKRSPALAEGPAIYAAFVASGFDPAIALGQFAAESAYGTAGYATTTRNWGNILYYGWLVKFGVKRYSPGNGYSYAQFPNWLASARAYIELMQWYKLRGWTTVSLMAASWLGTSVGTTRHGNYVRNIVAAANAALGLPTTPPKPPAPPVVDYSTWTADGLLAEIDRLSSKVNPSPSRDALITKLQGLWAKKVLVVPPAGPPPTPVTPPVPLSVIPTTPTAVEAVSNPYSWIDPVYLTLGGQPAISFGSSGPAFVLVHGGPEPLGLGHQGDLLSLGQRLADQGARAFCVDYRSDSWEHGVEDITKAVADVRKLVGTTHVTLVAHSFGGLISSIAFLRDGVGDAYVAVCAISSAAGYGGNLGGVPDPSPDPIVLAANRPTAPVSVLRGLQDTVASSDDKQGFVDALAKAGHPGLYTLGPGDHTGTLFTEATTQAIMSTARMLAG